MNVVHIEVIAYARWQMRCDTEILGGLSHQGPFKTRASAVKKAESLFPNLSPWTKGDKGSLSAKILEVSEK